MAQSARKPNQKSDSKRWVARIERRDPIDVDAFARQLIALSRQPGAEPKRRRKAPRERANQ